MNDAPPPTPARAAPSQPLAWLLGTDTKQRLRLVQCGIAMLLVLGSVLNMQYLVWAGLAPALPVAIWTAVLVGGFAFFFATIRTGFNLGLSDPSMTLPQMVFAISCGAAAYAIAGPGRGGAFPILMVIFMFSMYALPPLQVRRVGYFAVLLFGATMAVMAWRQPEVYDPAVEWGHFLMIAIMVPAISLLAGQMSRLRERIHRRNNDLPPAPRPLH